jgi:hypothetical protein
VRYGEDHNVGIVYPKDEVERKSAKNRSTEVSIEKPNGGTHASFGLPGGTFVGVP